MTATAMDLGNTSDHQKISFDRISWESTHEGARFKKFPLGEKQVRILELTPEFVEPDWCRRAHIGYVIHGEAEIDFDGEVIRFPEGSAFQIAAGDSHKARAITPTVWLFLVEDGAAGN